MYPVKLKQSCGHYTPFTLLYCICPAPGPAGGLCTLLPLWYIHRELLLHAVTCMEDGALPLPALTCRAARALLPLLALVALGPGRPAVSWGQREDTTENEGTAL